MDSMHDLLALLHDSIAYLRQKKVKNPHMSAHSLLAFVLNRKRSDLFLNQESSLQEKEVKTFRALIERRGKKEPLDYLIGRVNFLEVDLCVIPPVLIPRVETELLMDLALGQISNQKAFLWDLCTGSGCMGLAAKKRCPQLEVTLADLSQEALSLARQNGKINHLDVEYLEGDFLEPFKGRKADYVLCNPPYVSEEEYLHLEEEIYFESKKALVAQEEGLEFYLRLAEKLPSYLNPKAKIFLEIGATQGEKLMQIFNQKHWVLKRYEKDWAGIDRFFFLEFSSKLP